MDRDTYELKGQLLGKFKKPRKRPMPDRPNANPHEEENLKTARFFHDTKKHLSEAK